MTKKSTFTMSDVEASAAVFRSPLCDTHFYVVGREDMDFLEFMRRYNVGNVDCKRATGVQLDNTGDKFFMCYLEDCFDPPIAIVRADNAQDAVEWFVEECAWARLDPKDAQEREEEYGEDVVGYGPNGEPYDNEAMTVREICLARIECD